MATGALTRPAPSRGRGLGIARRWIFNLAYIGAVLIGWEVLVAVLDINILLLPPPTAVAREAMQFAGLIASSTLVTLTEALVGFAIAVLVGIGLAIVIVYSSLLRNVVLSTIVAINATPKVAVAPILVIWLGLGMESKIATAFLLSFFPIVINAVRGLADVPHDLLNLYRLMGATPIQVFSKVRLPSAMPALFDGFKIALPIAIIGAVAGEFVAARQGIGYQILLAYANFNSALVFAAVITIAVVATIMFQVLVAIEDRVIHWRPSKQVF